jgi:hypothetical protein
MYFYFAKLVLYLGDSFHHQFYFLMNFSFSRLLAVVAVVGVLFSSCSKSSDSSPAPTYGSATVNGKTYTWTTSSTSSIAGSLFSMAGAVSAENQLLGMATVTSASRPTAAGDLTFTFGKGLVFSETVNGSVVTRQYFKTTDKVTVTITGGKLTYTFTNLTETDTFGNAVVGGKSISGSIIES